MEIALSRRFAGLPDHRQALVRAQLADLSDIEIVAPKELVPVMSALATVVSTDVLTAAAVASALVLEAPIVVSTRSELLYRAATLAGVPTTHVARGGCRAGFARTHTVGPERGRVDGTS